MKIGTLLLAAVFGIGLYLVLSPGSDSPSNLNALPGALGPRPTPEVAMVDLVGPALEAHAGHNAIGAALQADAEVARSLTLRIGPRPKGRETVIGQLAARPRLATEDELEPEWYLGDRVLAVSLSGRDGGEGRVASFEGGAESALQTMALTWNDLPPDTYELTVELRGDAGSSKTQLGGIIVREGVTDQDPRLTAWDPMGGEVIVPFGTQDQTIELTGRLSAEVASRESPRGLDPGEIQEIHLKRLHPPGEWRLPIPSMWLDTAALPPAGYVVPIAVPAAGLYRWVAGYTDWSSEPFEIEGRAEPSMVEVKVRNAR